MPGKKRNQKKKAAAKAQEPQPEVPNSPKAEAPVEVPVEVAETADKAKESEPVVQEQQVEQKEQQKEVNLVKEEEEKQVEEQQVTAVDAPPIEDIGAATDQPQVPARPRTESIEVLDASPQTSPSREVEPETEKTQFKKEEEEVVPATQPDDEQAKQLESEEAAKAKLFAELESQYVGAESQPSPQQEQPVEAATVQEEVAIEETAQAGVSKGEETIVKEAEVNPYAAMITQASTTVESNDPIQPIQLDQKQEEETLQNTDAAAVEVKDQQDSQPQLVEIEEQSSQKPELVNEEKPKEADVQIEEPVKPETAPIVEQDKTQEEKVTQEQQPNAITKDDQVESKQEQSSAPSEPAVAVKPKKKKKKQAPPQQQEPEIKPPPAQEQAPQEQQQSSWPSLGLTGFLSKASQNLSSIKEQYNEQLIIAQKKKQEEDQWKKWQSDMAKEKQDKEEQEKQQRLEAKRQRKLQREKEKQAAIAAAAAQATTTTTEGEKDNTKSQASSTQQASESNLDPQELKMKKAQSIQPQNQVVVDPLNPLATPTQPSVVSTSSAAKKASKEQKQTPAPAKIPPEEKTTPAKKSTAEAPESPSITESSQGKSHQSQPLTLENLHAAQQQQLTKKRDSEINYQLQPPPDNSDLASSVSMNTAALYDNLESISQIGGSEQNNSESGTLDLQNIGIEISKRDKKIKDLLDDRVRLKNLLKKAKTAIDSINSKYKSLTDHSKSMEGRLTQVMDKNKDLVKTLEIIQKQRNGIEKADVKQILARIRCNDTSYTLIQNKQQECVWYQDTLILNVQDQMQDEFKQTKQVAYPGIFEQQQMTEKNLQQCMQQYEERLKRVNEYMEQSNSAYLKCQEELQQCRRKYAQELQDRDNALTLLIEKSIDLKSIVMSIDEKASNQMLAVRSQAQLGGQGMTAMNKRKQANLGDLIQDLEMQITGMMNVNASDMHAQGGNTNDQNVLEIRNHLIDLYQRIAVGLLKKHQQYVERLQTTEKEWQETCDQLINEVQSIKEERERQELQMSEQIRSQTEQLNQLKTDHYRVVKANEENTEKLKTEISNSLNAHYLKNILTQYFTTNDTTVQVSLLKVVFKVMKFTEEEQQRIQDTWNENNKSTFQRMFDFGMGGGMQGQ